MNDEIKKILNKSEYSLEDMEKLQKHLDDGDSDFLLDCPDEIFDALIPKIETQKLKKSKEQFLSELLNNGNSTVQKQENPILRVIDAFGKISFSSKIPKFGYAGVNEQELRDIVIPEGILGDENSHFSIKVNREDKQYLDISLKNMEYAIYISLQMKIFFEDGESITLTSKNKRNISRPWKVDRKPIIKIEVHYQNESSK